MPLLEKSAVGAMPAVDTMPNTSSVSMSIWLPMVPEMKSLNTGAFFILSNT
jgi:selenophosphate synthetase-related protein